MSYSTYLREQRAATYPQLSPTEGNKSDHLIRTSNIGNGRLEGRCGFLINCRMLKTHLLISAVRPFVSTYLGVLTSPDHAGHSLVSAPKPFIELEEQSLLEKEVELCRQVWRLIDRRAYARTSDAARTVVIDPKQPRMPSSHGRDSRDKYLPRLGRGGNEEQ
ncbi:hypothetical protein VTI28DRAFT_54 [Corynascus sepedonium]